MADHLNVKSRSPRSRSFCTSLLHLLARRTVGSTEAGRSSYVSADILASVAHPGAMAAASWYKAAAFAVKNACEKLHYF